MDHTKMKGASHLDQLASLRRIEGQVRGIQRMIGKERYCAEILNASAAIRGALRRVEMVIFKDHLNSCIRNAFYGSSKKAKQEKLKEIYQLLENLRK